MFVRVFLSEKKKKKIKIFSPSISFGHVYVLHYRLIHKYVYASWRYDKNANRFIVSTFPHRFEIEEIVKNQKKKSSKIHQKQP